MTHLRWGILGAAKFAREHMGPAIHAATGAELCAVASRDIAKVRPFQDFAPGCRAVGNYDDLIHDDNIDAVYIPLPHTMHKEWTIKALNAGKHVLAEKPIAMQANDFAEMIAARDASGCLAAEAYMIVHHAQWRRVKDMIRDGAIGEVQHIQAAFSYDNSSDPGNIRNKAETGGGGLRDIGVYTIGGPRFAMDAELTGVNAQIRWHDGFDLTTHAQGYLGTATFSMYTSIRMHPHQEVVFHGRDGLIRMTAPFNPRVFGEARIELHQPGQGLRVEKFPTDDQYKQQVEAFGRSVNEATPYPWTLEMAQGTQTAIDEILTVATDI